MAYSAAATTATKLLAVYAAFLAIGLPRSTSARELRPSYHGLGYYYQQQRSALPSAGQRPSPEMKSFFNVPPSLKSSSNSSSSPSTSVGLPRSMNTSDEAWWRSVSGWRSEDRVRKALLIGSLVCGISGAVLLVASCAVYLVKRRAIRRSTAASVVMGSAAGSSTANSTPNNSYAVSTLAIVPKLTDQTGYPPK